eukprot:CAMPEP_0176483756 /NCGR_PEP_ID=MMETSP0200_2-20121128/4089_1 /TAXON_ID=947934 /ORGANISM="Chaetoceros sp., Strain GSL56" /LENGTH=253 /DNA_ID=CAMNT_0017880181 /DNA_START=100 /DNA_END=861 /DNA_ORIENTATION=+
MALNNITNTYTADYPTLDPLASGLDDLPPVEPIAAGTPLNVKDILDAELQMKTRAHYHKTKHATDAEVAAAKKRQFQIEMEHAASGAIGLPAWANGLQTAIQNLTQNVTTLTETVGGLNRDVGTLTRDVRAINQRLERQEEKLDNLNRTVCTLTRDVNDPVHGLKAISYGLKAQDAQNINRSSVRTNSDPIKAIPHPTEGSDAEPRWMPRTYTDILQCTARNADVYLDFYKIDGGRTLADKRVEIRKHLGITI